MAIATSALSDRVSLLVGPDLADLAEATDSVTLAAATSSASLATRLTHDRAEHLSRAQAPDALRARSRRRAEATWNPTVYLGEDITHEPIPEWAGLAVVTTSNSETTDRWLLKVAPDGAARLHPLSLDLTPARLPDDAYASLLELLRTAGKQDESPVHSVPASADVEAVEALVAIPPGTGTGTHGAEEEVPGANALPDAPRVLLLGPAQVTGTIRGSSDDRSRRNTKLVAYLALHPGTSAAELDEIIGRGAALSTATRNTTISRARGRLGKTRTTSPTCPPSTPATGTGSPRMSPPTGTTSSPTPAAGWPADPTEPMTSAAPSTSFGAARSAASARRPTRGQNPSPKR